MNQYDVMGGTVDVVGRTQYAGYAAPQVFTGATQRGMMIHPPSTGGALDDLKAWLDKRSVANIPNKYLVAGAALAGLAYYGHTQRWF